MATAVRVPEGVAVGRDPHRVALLGLAVAGVAATAGAASLAHAGAESQPGLSPLARALIVAVPIAVGAYAWHRGPDAGFGLLLIAAGAGWAVPTLAETDASATLRCPWSQQPGDRRRARAHQARGREARQRDLPQTRSHRGAGRQPPREGGADLPGRDTD